ncbi:MAG TPA: hypothetical protein VFS92_10910 [Planctomycetota bacterium]|nr:hypothetical protein [Planctomycetota bacterium]
MARFERDVLLKGRLRIRVLRGPAEERASGVRVMVRGCGFA